MTTATKLYDLQNHRENRRASSYTQVKSIKKLDSTQMKLSNAFKRRKEERD